RKRIHAEAQRALRNPRKDMSFSASSASVRETIPRFLVAFPVDLLGISPQIFQAEVRACLGVENMHYDVAVVLHDPARRFIAFDAETLFAFGMHGGIDLFRNRMDLPPASASGQNEVIVQRSKVAHVQDDDVLCFVLRCDPSAQSSTL